MRRDPDLDRQILFAVEAYDGESPPHDVDLSGLDAPKIQKDYQIRLLSEAGLIKALDASSASDPLPMLPVRLTMAGHECLDSIRDEEVWKRTKAGAQAVGNFSLDLLGALAEGFARETVRKYTGLEIDL